MNLSVGQDQQDEVCHQVAALHREVHEDVHDAAEEGGTSHVNPPHVLLVSGENAVDRADLWLIEAAIQWEAVARLILIHEARYAAEAEAWEVLELIVGLENVTDLSDRLTILVLFVERVQRGRIRRLPV